MCIFKVRKFPFDILSRFGMVEEKQKGGRILPPPLGKIGLNVMKDGKSHFTYSQFSINHMVPIYSTFLFCLSLQGTTAVIRQDQVWENKISLRPTFFFQQLQIGYMVVQHTKMEMPYTFTIIIFSDFPLYFVSYSPLVKQYSF